jgi:hypothetical protein
MGINPRWIRRLRWQKQVKKNKDVYWIRQDVFTNRVSLPVWVWEQHASKHALDKYPATEEHIYQAVVNPDYAHRSLDPDIGGETCIFEKFFEAEPFFVPVLYEGVVVPGDYEQGGKSGRVLTGYFPGRLNIPRTIGEVFWSKPISGGEDSK